MRIIANENIPGLAVRKLRDRGHDVIWIRESDPGSADHEVLALARAENRLLITFDKDFGELAFRHGFPAVNGVLLFRPRKAPPDFYAEWILRTLESRDDWSGNFSVIEVDRIRMTVLPNLGGN